MAGMSDAVRFSLVKQLFAELKAGSLSEGSSSFREYRKHFPESPTPFILLGSVYEQQSRFKQAFENYLQADYLLEAGSEQQPSMLFFLSQTKTALVACALRYYVQSADAGLVEQLVGEGYDDGLLFWAMGKISFDKKDFGAALRWFDKSLNKKTDLLEHLVIDAYLVRGVCNMVLDNRDAGERDLKMVAERDAEKCAFVNCFLADFYEDAGDYKKSLEYRLNSDFAVEESE